MLKQWRKTRKNLDVNLGLSITQDEGEWEYQRQFAGWICLAFTLKARFFLSTGEFSTCSGTLSYWLLRHLPNGGVLVRK